MGAPFSMLLTSPKTNVKEKVVLGSKENPSVVNVERSISFKGVDGYPDNNSVIQDELSPNKRVLETDFSFKNLVLDRENFGKMSYISNKPSPLKAEPLAIFSSPRPLDELDAAAVKVQKVYKSYRTRRNLADCAVVVEELWWKALDFAELRRSSVSFFNNEKPESAVSRWVRARNRVAKVGKGLCKDEKAQKLAIRHWLEAIDPRHRYGHNLHLYYDVWFSSMSSQPFFYWLDVGDGKEVNVEKCPRSELQRQCIKYLGPKERESYEVIIECGKLMYKQSGAHVETKEDSKWIFVLDTSRKFYVGEKKKGEFQHSSFLAGAATTAAGRIVAHDGVLKAIWPYSGHYHPTEENFKEFLAYLEEHQVDLTNVKKCAIDEDDPYSSTSAAKKPKPESKKGVPSRKVQPVDENSLDTTHIATLVETFGDKGKIIKSPRWTSGAGPRIGCVREYPSELQFQALEQVNLSPRVMGAPFSSSGPIPSPRPSPRVHLSHRLSNMGLTSPSPKGTSTYN